MRIRLSIAVISVFGGIPVLAVAQVPAVDIRPASGTVLGHGAEAPITWGAVTAAVQLPDETIVVADGQSVMIHFFNAKGHLIASRGRLGSGPGEFRNLASLQSCARNRVLVFDSELSRVSEFTADGRFVRVVTISAGQGRLVYSMTCDESGYWLLASWPRFNKSLPIGPYRESQDLFLADSNGIVVKALGSVLATERYRHERSDGPRTFGKVTVMAINQGRLYIGDGEESTLAVRSLQSGASLPDLRYDSPKVPVTQSDIARHLEDHLATVRSPSHREAQRRASATYVYPEAFPPYGSLMFRQEQVWIADYPTPERTSEAWTVIDHSGQVAGRVVLPRGFELLDVGARHGIVRWTAEDGSQEPRVYPLRRQTRSK